MIHRNKSFRNSKKLRVMNGIQGDFHDSNGTWQYIDKTVTSIDGF